MTADTMKLVREALILANNYIGGGLTGKGEAFVALERISKALDDLSAEACPHGCAPWVVKTDPLTGFHSGGPCPIHGKPSAEGGNK